MPDTGNGQRHVIVVGGGFAGVGAAQRLAKQDDVQVTRLDRNNRNRIGAFIASGWDNFTSGHGPQVLDRSQAAHIPWGEDETPAETTAAEVS